MLDNKAQAIARELNLRVIAIDRPGYGLSSLKPGRTIAEWGQCSDGIVVADHLKLHKFLVMGISTGAPPTA